MLTQAGRPGKTSLRMEWLSYKLKDRKGRRNGMCQDPVAPPESRVRYNGMATAEIWVA